MEKKCSFRVRVLGFETLFLCPVKKGNENKKENNLILNIFSDLASVMSCRITSYPALDDLSVLVYMQLISEFAV